VRSVYFLGLDLYSCYPDCYLVDLILFFFEGQDACRPAPLQVGWPELDGSKMAAKVPTDFIMISPPC
jgi:hypothetical protein